MLGQPKFTRFRAGVVALASVLIVGGAGIAPAAHAVTTVPRFDHVIHVFLENESATSTWASDPVLKSLSQTYAYIPGFYGVGHASLDNYEAAFGAVAPTTQGKADCAGMPYGTCIFPSAYPTIGGLLDQSGYSWRVFSEGEQGAPLGHPCLHALDRNLPDFYQGPGTNGYATRHNPAPWFDSILSHGGSEQYCQDHNPDLSAFPASAAALPTYSFIEPDTCHDGHDTASTGGCTLDPEGPAAPSGVAAVAAWLPGFIHQVTSLPGWSTGRNVLFVTFDEGAATDASGCSCGDGSAGGQVGAIVVSPIAKTAFTSAWRGDHYGVLATLEASLGLPSLKATAPASIAAQIHDGDVAPLTDVWLP